MPLLLNGQYSIAVAIADGYLESHVQHHIVMEAIIIDIMSIDLPRRYYAVALDYSDYVVYNVNI